ncbi:MAG: hypothetical protein ACKV19_24335 [Verrucomicrobiales bacterium]
MLGIVLVLVLEVAAALPTCPLSSSLALSITGDSPLPRAPLVSG